MILRLPVLLAGVVAALAMVVQRFGGGPCRHRSGRSLQYPGGGGESRRTGGCAEGPGPFTVFAPTDEAFAKLPPGTLENLLKPENKDELRKILTYHVVAGRVTAKDVVKLDSAKTLEGWSVVDPRHWIAE